MDASLALARSRLGELTSSHEFAVAEAAQLRTELVALRTVKSEKVPRLCVSLACVLVCCA